MLVDFFRVPRKLVPREVRDQIKLREINLFSTIMLRTGNQTPCDSISISVRLIC